MAQRQNDERVCELEEKVREMRMLNARLHTKVYRLEEEIRRMDERLAGMGQRVTACQKEKKELTEELERMKRIVDEYEVEMETEEGKEEAGGSSGMEGEGKSGCTVMETEEVKEDKMEQS